MKAAYILFLLFGGAAALAAECDCSNYPFKPNPPCYGLCVAKLSANKDFDLMQVKDIDPGVSIGIKVLGSRTDRSEIDFAKILGKKDLEGVALKSIQNKNIKLEAATKLKQ